ncbi:MAG: hypothetical protein QOI65_1131 [Thermoleophilaceae bacterium]|nr:hypothetical protein [Thermoleophilaceae bacterium]
MNAHMGETAVTPGLTDTAPEPEFRPTVRERMGIATFVVVAVLATTAWIALLVWGAAKLIGQL